MTTLSRFLKCESGATAIEYGLLAGLLSIAIATVAVSLGSSLRGTFELISTQLADALSKM